MVKSPSRKDKCHSAGKHVNYSDFSLNFIFFLLNLKGSENFNKNR